MTRGRRGAPSRGDQTLTEGNKDEAELAARGAFSTSGDGSNYRRACGPYAERAEMRVGDILQRRDEHVYSMMLSPLMSGPTHERCFESQTTQS